MTMTLDLAVDLLQRCLVEPDPMVRLDLIHRFEDAIRDAEDVGDERTRDVLATAGLDLSYYEPRKEWREDRSLYDDRELDRRLREILRDLGQTVPDAPALAETSVWRRVLNRIGLRRDTPTRDLHQR